MKNINIIFICLTILFQSCEKNPELTGISPKEFNDLIADLDYLNQPDEIPEPVVVEVITDEENSGDYVCCVKRFFCR